MAATYKTRQGDMLDEICWRHYGTQSGAVELVLEANPGLADLGLVLPLDTEIVLPDLPEVPAEEKTMRLWD